MIKGNMLIKSEEFSCDDLGTIPEQRDIETLLEKGFVVVDKDSGPTSHATADLTKKVLQCSKTGHSGTLDPKVTGVLVMGLGKGTRLMEYMLKSDKVYVCLMHVHKEVTKEKILEVFDKFTGTIMQMPPVISAVKREERPRTIYSIDLLDYQDNGKSVLFKVSCQHGTYIRKLCSDIGEYLGVGAQKAELRRTKAGPFTEDDFSISLDKLRNLFTLFLKHEGDFEAPRSNFEVELRKYIRPMEDLLCEFPKIIVHDSCVDSLVHGYDLATPGVSSLSKNIKPNDVVGIYTAKGELIGIGNALMSSDEIMKQDKGFCASVHKVFMDVGYYPNMGYFRENYPEVFPTRK